MAHSTTPLYFLHNLEQKIMLNFCSNVQFMFKCSIFVHLPKTRLIPGLLMSEANNSYQLCHNHSTKHRVNCTHTRPRH